MLSYFVRQDLEQRFRGNALGFAWAFLSPLAQLGLFALVFAYIFGARLSGIEGVSYVAFLSLGMWPWFAFSEGVSRGTAAFTDHAGLLAKVALTPWRLVAARVLGAFVLHGAGFLLVLGVLLALGQPIKLAWLPLALPVWLALAIFTFASALLLAVFNPFLRDLQLIVQYLVTASMFLAPILYNAALVPEPLGWWLRLNPLTGYIEAIRDPLLLGAPAALPLNSLVATALVLALAVFAYRRVRPHLVEFL